MAEPVPLAVPVAEALGALLLLPELLRLPDTEALAPLLRVAVGEEEAEPASRLLLLLLPEGVALPVGVGERLLLPVPVAEAEREEEMLQLGVPEGLTDALAQ